MAYTTINKSTDYFNTATYTGTGSNQTISNTFQSDMIWVKGRNYAYNHSIQDAVRGFSANKVIYPNLTNVEGHYSDTGYIQSVASNNFVVGTGTHSDDANYNDNGSTYVAWNWKANGAGSANTDGTINSTVSVNTTSGFSIVKYVATGSNATVGHGLGVAPAFIILKNLDTARSWTVGSNGNTDWSNHTYLDATNAQNSDSSMFQSTAPTSTVFSIGTAAETNESGDNFIAYCFAEKVGYCKVGKYIGNGSTTAFQQPFIYTGFKPSFVLIKQTTSATNWEMFDNKRVTAGYPPELHPNANAAESTPPGDRRLNLLSNGFLIDTSYADPINKDGNTFLYMAIGQTLTGSNDVPCTAF